MFEDWQCPDWGPPWEPEAEFALAKQIAARIHGVHPDVVLKLDTEIVGCMFVQLWRADVLIGRFTLSLVGDVPLVSMHLGAEEDEFHLTNLDAIAALPGFYTTEYPEEESQRCGAANSGSAAASPE